MTVSSIGISISLSATVTVATPTVDQQPLHCLLDDDKLITRVSVETDRLLIPDVDPKDVVVTIRVTVKGFTATYGNLGIIG